MAALEKIAAQTAQVESGLETLQNQRESLQRQLDSASEKLSAARLGENLERAQFSERLEVLEQAVLPQKPFKPNRRKLLAIVVGLALVAGFGCVVLMEMLDTSIRGTRDVYAVAAPSLIQGIPYIATKKELLRQRLVLILGAAGVGRGVNRRRNRSSLLRASARSTLGFGRCTPLGVINMPGFDNGWDFSMNAGSGTTKSPLPLSWSGMMSGQDGHAGMRPPQSYEFAEGAFRPVVLDEAYLESARIIGHDVTDPRAKSYDILRTHVLQAMDLHDWHLLGITSPTKGCGKTLTSINLALSICRQMERAVLLIDMDFRKPQLAARLGVESNIGLLDVIDGRVALSEAMFQVRAGRHSLLVLPTDPTDVSAELIASRAMQAFIQELRRDFRSYVVILDLPPMLVSDDVTALLPQIDCALLVAAVGTSTVAEIEECGRHLQSTNLVRVVVNKVPESKKMYY